ncbi:ricin-type beta-trefoil lectin domain protein [Streptomyces sp. NPDC005728]|uniref:ricin-type beta-trefoil lectin domain protein n=1 Tax=Streptomyces sp. NPDC005728 TaxID=3157054 RepID=UPI0033CE4A25
MSEALLSKEPSSMSDGELTAMLWQGPRRDSFLAVAELFSRHWSSVYRYAGLCTRRPAAAIELAKEAFHLVQRETRDAEARPFAWRPRLLATVLACAAAWSRGEHRTDLNSEILAWLDEPGNAEEAEAGGPPTLARCAFAELPEQSQCLLWHSVAEADPPAAVSRLTGQSEQATMRHLERARKLFREECVQAHLTRTINRECLAYGSLLDAATRTETADPGPQDLDRHLTDCAHCRTAAEELQQHSGRLPLVLSNGLLAWGAKPYLDTRKTDDTPVTDPSRPVHRTGTRPASIAVAAGVAAVALLAIAATVSDLAAPADNSASPLQADQTSSYTQLNTTTASPQPGTQLARTQLRNAKTGQCLDVRDGRLAAKTDVISARCTSTASQQWVFGNDSLMHTAADPNLCLDTTGDGSAVLHTCNQPPGHDTMGLRLSWNKKGEISTLTPPDLALTPVPANGPDDIVLKIRDGSTAQIWLAKTPPPETSLTKHAAPSTSLTETSPSPSPSPSPSRSSTPSPPPASSRSSTPSPSPSVQVSVGPAQPDEFWGTAWPFVATATGFAPNQDIGFYYDLPDRSCDAVWVTDHIKADSTGKAVWIDKMVYTGTRAAPPYTFNFCAVDPNGSRSAKATYVVH